MGVGRERERKREEEKAGDGFSMSFELNRFLVTAYTNKNKQTNEYTHTPNRD